MVVSRSLILVSLLCSLLLAAGCTHSTPSPVPPAAGPVLADLALTPADLPPGFTLAESRAKNSSDVGTLARQLGWQGGYVVRYSGTSPDGGRQTAIVQSIAVYPAGTVPDIVTIVDKQDQSDTDLNYTEIRSGVPGDHGTGFYGRASAPVLVKATNVNPLVPGPENQDVETLAKDNIAEVIFSRGTTFEVISITGPGADVATVTALAQKAYAKIP
jgi:hypothetical protein